MSAHPGLWPGRWPAEDAGPQRLAAPLRPAGLGLVEGSTLACTSREVVMATMVVLRDEGEAYLLRHTPPPDAVSFVERIDPITLEPLARSVDLPGGPMWPGGMAAHADGSLHVVFGNHAHRLSADLEVEASVTLPRAVPYNSFVTLPGGQLVTKDFAGPWPGQDPAAIPNAELLVLDPVDLHTIASLEITEPSVARLSAQGDEIVVVGTESLISVDFVDGALVQRGPGVRYRDTEGQGCGWDAVLDGDLAFFLDDGDGSDAYDGSFRDRGTATAPLRLHRIDRRAGSGTSVEVCGRPGGLIANPPALDPTRRIAVGYDSGNGVVTAVHADTLEPLWSIDLDHACHPLVLPETGELVMADFDRAVGVEHVVVLDLATGAEKGRVATESLLQSPVFPAIGFDRDLYWVTFMTVSRVAASGPSA
jgi:hypothetical protein